MDGAVLLLYPVAVWGVRRLVGWVLRRRILVVEQEVRRARALQKQKVEELKKQTSYYQTRGLLERFDPDYITTGSGISKMGGKETTMNKMPSAPLAPSGPTIPPSGPSAPMSPGTPTTVIQHVATPTWFDRLMDSLIGDDRMSKYALICPRCHSHNGLVRPEDYDSIQYSCPNCKLFVPARKPGSPLVMGSSVGSVSASPVFTGEPDISSDSSLEVPPPAVSPSPVPEPQLTPVPEPELTPEPEPEPEVSLSPAPSATASTSTTRRRKK